MRSVDPGSCWPSRPGISDTATGKEIIDLLAGLAAEHGSTVIALTHDATLAERRRGGSRSATASPPRATDRSLGEDCRRGRRCRTTMRRPKGVGNAKKDDRGRRDEAGCQEARHAPHDEGRRRRSSLTWITRQTRAYYISLEEGGMRPENWLLAQSASWSPLAPGQGGRRFGCPARPEYPSAMRMRALFALGLCGGIRVVCAAPAGA